MPITNRTDSHGIEVELRRMAEDWQRRHPHLRSWENPWFRAIDASGPKAERMLGGGEVEVEMVPARGRVIRLPIWVEAGWIILKDYLPGITALLAAIFGGAVVLSIMGALLLVLWRILGFVG